MNARAPTLALILAACIVLPGCVVPNASPASEPTWHSQESATYESTLPDGTLLNMTVAMTQEGAWLQGNVTVVKTLPSGGVQEVRAEFWANATTGALQRAQVPLIVTRPEGALSYLPSPGRVFDIGLNFNANNHALVRNMHIWVPAWIAHAPPGTEAWAGVSFHRTSDGTSYEIALEFPCAFVCYGPSPDEARVTIEADGPLNSRFPDHVAVGYTGGLMLEWTKTGGTRAGSPEPIAVEVPGVDALPSEARLCTLTACAGEQLPPRLSLQRGMEALAADPKWVAFQAQHPDAVPLMQYITTADLYLNDQTLIDPDTWFLVFSDAEGCWDFVVQEAPRGAPAYTVDLLSPRDCRLDGPMPTQQRGPFLETYETLSSALAPVGLGVDRIETLQLDFFSERLGPAERFSGGYTAHWDTEDGPYFARINARTGHLGTFMGPNATVLLPAP